MENLQEIARAIMALEKQCQNGVDIEENEKEMERIFTSLNFKEMLTLASLLEDMDLQN